MAQDLEWPRSTGKHVCAFFFFAIGNMLTTFLMIGGIPLTTMACLLIPLGCLSVDIVFLYMTIPMILVSAWVEKFIMICEAKNEKNKTVHTKRCLDLFVTLNKALGTFFAFVFRNAIKITVLNINT